MDSNAEKLVCPTCRYSLRGLPENICPECGCAFDPKELLARLNNPGVLRASAPLLAALSLLVGIVSVPTALGMGLACVDERFGFHGCFYDPNSEPTAWFIAIVATGLTSSAYAIAASAKCGQPSARIGALAAISAWGTLLVILKTM